MWDIATARQARSLIAAHAVTQGVGALVLGWFTFLTRGSAGGELSFAGVWTLLLFVGGVSALLCAKWHTEWFWSFTASVLAAAMWGRGVDILWHVDEFVGRPRLAVAIWMVMGAGTVSAWVAVGALAGLVDNDRGG